MAASGEAYLPLVSHNASFQKEIGAQPPHPQKKRDVGRVFLCFFWPGGLLIRADAVGNPAFEVLLSRTYTTHRR